MEKSFFKILVLTIIIKICYSIIKKNKLENENLQLRSN